MNNLSYTEAYFLATLGTLTDPEDREPLINLLLGVYTCHLLGPFETTKGENLLKEIQKIQNNNVFFLLIDRLKDLGFIEVEKITSFPNVAINRITIENGKKGLVENPLPKKVLSLFRKKIRSSFESHKKSIQNMK